VPVRSVAALVAVATGYAGAVAVWACAPCTDIIIAAPNRTRVILAII
jgi:hypothetical protein